jgi:hypothetical protein
MHQKVFMQINTPKDQIKSRKPQEVSIYQIHYWNMLFCQTIDQTREEQKAINLEQDAAE